MRHCPVLPASWSAGPDGDVGRGLRPVQPWPISGSADVKGRTAPAPIPIRGARGVLRERYRANPRIPDAAAAYAMRSGHGAARPRRSAVLEQPHRPSRQQCAARRLGPPRSPITAIFFFLFFVFFFFLFFFFPAVVRCSHARPFADNPDWRILSCAGNGALSPRAGTRTPPSYPAPLKIVPSSVLLSQSRPFYVFPRICRRRQNTAGRAYAIWLGTARVLQNLGLVVGRMAVFAEAESIVEMPICRQDEPP